VYRRDKNGKRVIKMLKHLGVALGLLLFFISVSVGDEIITLNDGKEYRGKIIIESPTRVVLKTAKGKVTLEKSLIKARRKSLSVEDEFRSRLSKIGAADVEGWRQLARWAKENGLKDESRDCYEKVVGLKADDEEARTALKNAKKAKEKEEEQETDVDRGRRTMREKLENVQVHFDFGRATIPTIVTAIANAAGVRIKIDKSAMKDLKKRRIKLRYKSDHTAYRSLLDVTKHSKLDFLIDTEMVVIGTASSINRLRKKLGIRKKKIRILSGVEAQKVLDTSKHTLRCSEKKFSSVLSYLRKSTPVKYLYDGPSDYLEKKVTFDVYQRPLKTILDRVLQPLELDYMLQGNVVYIAAKAKIAALKSDGDEKGKN
jgi:hypothetical protein